MIAGTRGFTLIEVLFVVALMGLLAAIGMPGLMRAKMASAESSAIASVRTINSGQQAFWTTCGAGNYSPSLQNLALPVGGSPGYVSPDVGGPAPVIKSGYELDLATTNPSPLVSCNGAPTAVTYHVTADPQVGRGRRYFGSNGGGTIYESTATLFGAMPDDRPPAAPAFPLGR